MEVNVQNVLIRSEYGTAKRCFMIFMDRFKPKGERTEKDGDGIHQPRIQVLLSLTCCMSLNPKVYQITTISNHIQSHHSSTKSLSEALASSSHRHSWVPPCEASVDAQDRRGCCHLSHCHDQSNTPSIFSVYSCVNIVYVYTYIHIHTYIHNITLHYIALHCITLHYITLPYLTLHYITLPYITLHYITYIQTYIHTLHYITLHCIALHCIALHYITLHSIA